MKKDFDPADVVIIWETGLQEEIKEKEEKNSLTQDSKGLYPAVFFRAFFFQW